MAASQYLSSGSHFLTVVVSPFSSIQSDTQADTADLGLIDMCISDSRNLEDGESRPTPSSMVSVDLDDPHAMVSETEW